MFEIVQKEKGRLLPWRDRMRAAARWVNCLHGPVKEGWDPALLGWGLIAPENLDPIYMVVLRTLLEHRQATVYARGGCLEIFYYRKGEDPEVFLARNGFAQPQTPYYLLILGSDDFVPRALENRLKCSHAVGRLDFCIPEEYLHYARALVKSETGRVCMSHGVTLLNHREEGIRIANQLLEKQEESPRRWLISDMASQSIDRWEALTLHLTPSGRKQRAPITRTEAPNLRGHLVFQLGNSCDDAMKLEGGFAQFFHWRDLLSSPTRAALAMVRFNRKHVVSSLAKGLPGILDGLTVGAALGRLSGQNLATYSIYGDPAARLAQTT